MHIIRKTAGRTFTAKCGCKIVKGETYVKSLDYIMGNRVHDSFCIPCWNANSVVKVEVNPS